MSETELIEKFADKEHASWARWMEYLFSKCVPDPQLTDALIIPAPYVRHWLEEIKASHDMPEHHKQSEALESREEDDVSETRKPKGAMLTKDVRQAIYVLLEYMVVRGHWDADAACLHIRMLAGVAAEDWCAAQYVKNVVHQDD